MTLTDIVICIANLIYAAALLVREVLLLRILILASSLILLTWGALKEEWVFVAWSVLFFIINGWNIVVLIRERMHVELSPELDRIRDAVFPELGRREFLSFWNFGSERRYGPGERLIDEGASPESLLLLVEGSVRVMRGGHEIARLGAGSFAGEMSFLTARPAIADVVADGNVRALLWSQAKLHDLGQINPGLIATLNRVLGRDLSEKVSLAGLPRSRPA